MISDILYPRRAIHCHFVAELADFRLRPTTARQVDVADVEDGFVFAPSAAEAMEGRQAVVHVGRRGVAGPPSSDSGAASQEFEVGVAVAAAIAPKAFGVHVDAFAVGEVEVYFDHAAFFVFAGDFGLEGADVGGLPAVAPPLPAQAGVFGATNAEQVAEGRSVGGVGFDGFGQGAGVFFRVGAADAEVGGGLFGGIWGGGLVGDFGVVIGVVVRDVGGVGGDEAESGGLGQYGSLELVMPCRTDQVNNAFHEAPS